MTALIVMIAIILIAIFVIIGTRNGIVTSKNRVMRAWSDVMAYERKKLKLLPSLEDVLKQYTAYEQGLMEKVVALRTSIQQINSSGNYEKVIDTSVLKSIEDKSKEFMSALRMTVENYPNLKADALYSSFMREISEVEQNVAGAITIYNDGVERFNNAIETFPGNWVNARYNRENKINEFTDTEAAKDVAYKPNFQNS